MNRVVHGIETCHVNVRKLLKYMTECLIRSPGCVGVGLAGNKITTEHKYYLLLLIRYSKYVTFIGLMGNNLRGTMSLLGPALNYSNIDTLLLSHCNLDDEDIIYLGKALRSNQKLQQLAIGDNNVSKYTIFKFIENIQHSAITLLHCDRDVIDTTEFHLLLLDVNTKRMESNREPLVVRPSLSKTDEIVQCRQWYETMASLPPETVTGREGVDYHPLHMSI